MKDCHWRRRIILTVKINPQNWWVIERANSQFRNRLKSLQSVANELQTPEVPRKAQWVPSNFPPTRARGSPGFRHFLQMPSAAVQYLTW